MLGNQCIIVGWILGQQATSIKPSTADLARLSGHVYYSASFRLPMCEASFFNFVGRQSFYLPLIPPDPAYPVSSTTMIRIVVELKFRSTNPVTTIECDLSRRYRIQTHRRPITSPDLQQVFPPDPHQVLVEQNPTQPIKNQLLIQDTIFFRFPSSRISQVVYFPKIHKKQLMFFRKIFVLGLFKRCAQIHCRDLHSQRRYYYLHLGTQ
jgi:hypothetical protein